MSVHPVNWCFYRGRQLYDELCHLTLLKIMGRSAVRVQMDDMSETICGANAASQTDAG
jgi:hypothetical protein